MTIKLRQTPALPPERVSLGARLGHFFYMMYAGLMSVIGWVAEPLQRWVSMKNMAYFFVLPNLIIFGVFVLFPMLLNIYYAFTGGTALFPQDRPFVGGQNFQQIFTCTNFLDPNSCREDRFWRGLYNTVFYVIFQVGGMVALSMLTAVVLNRSIRGRGFFRSVFFYPVLLSPVVIALIWKWILQRDGLLNALLVTLGMERVVFFLNANCCLLYTSRCV